MYARFGRRSTQARSALRKTLALARRGDAKCALETKEGPDKLLRPVDSNTGSGLATVVDVAKKALRRR